MANLPGMTSSFKSEILLGAHQLGAVTIVSRTSLTAPTTDIIKGALFAVTASRGVADTVYNTTGENTGGSGYTAGGVVVTNAVAPSTSGTAGIWTPSAALSWGPTFSSGAAFDCLVLYNSTQGNREISVHTFSSQSVTSATFQLSMPSNAPGTALIQIS
jgi:hypothetical protein